MRKIKKLLIVNNHMHIGGVQKALVSLLHEIKEEYDITLYLFSPRGTYYNDIPESVKIITAKSMYRCFGVSQDEAKENILLYLTRSVLAVVTKLFGRSVAVSMANLSQRKLKEHYDVAVSYLHSGDPKSFYGGCNDFVIHKVRADKKVTFLHGDYSLCGANHKNTNALYRKFDIVAACSEGCRQSFVAVLPDMADRCIVVPNCHDYAQMLEQGDQNTVTYEDGLVHLLTIARLTKEKGVARGIEAIAYVREQGADVCYHIVGDGVERDSLKQMVQNLQVEDCVRFYGNQENPYRFLPNADLLLIPSYHEAAPLVIDEARCFGVPVLSTETSSANEMITNRALGWVCENDQAAISQTLLRVIKNLDQLKEKKMHMLNTKCSNEIAVSAFRSAMR